MTRPGEYGVAEREQFYCPEDFEPVELEPGARPETRRLEAIIVYPVLSCHRLHHVAEPGAICFGYEERAYLDRSKDPGEPAFLLQEFNPVKNAHFMIELGIFWDEREGEMILIEQRGINASVILDSWGGILTERVRPEDGRWAEEVSCLRHPEFSVAAPRLRGADLWLEVSNLVEDESESAWPIDWPMIEAMARDGGFREALKAGFVDDVMSQISSLSTAAEKNRWISDLISVEALGLEAEDVAGPFALDAIREAVAGAIEEMPLEKMAALGEKLAPKITE
jgi:hypothetical protein